MRWQIFIFSKFGCLRCCCKNTKLYHFNQHIEDGEKRIMKDFDLKKVILTIKEVRTYLKEIRI